MIGMVPSLNQIALALGIFLLLPLGDRFSNRKLVTIFASFQVAMLGIMAFASQYWLFVVASSLLGFFTIAPYLIPAYVSRRVPVTRLGHSNAILTTGVIFGILVARAGAGVVAEMIGWRSVYIIAAALMLAVSILLFFRMEDRDTRQDNGPKQNYFALIFSVFPMMRVYPEILLSGAIQGLGFGSFLAVWMGIGLHLTSPEMGYGTDTVGYLAILTIFNLAVTPRLGRWADRTGPRRARLIIAAIQVFGVVIYSFVGHSLWLMIIPILITNTGGPIIDVSNRMTFLKENPNVRTRLMTIYIVMMFIGGGIASWAGTAAYDFGGWHGTSFLALGLTGLLFTLCLFGYLWKGAR